MALEQDIANMVGAADKLTQEVAGKMSAIDAKVAQAEIDFNNLTPEKRIVTEITIGGSSDFLYPVWWGFPGDAYGVSKLTIARQFNINAAEPIGGVLGLQDHSHAYGLMLELEGNGNAWSGGANFMQIKRFSETYDVGISHVQFSMHCDAALSASDAYPARSGCYLRGGGLTYQIISNQDLGVQFQDGSGGVDAATELYQGGGSVWFVKPIALGAKDPVTGLYPGIQTPAADLLPY